MKKRLLNNEDKEELLYAASTKVSFTEEQDLTEAQKRIARKNIGVDGVQSGGEGGGGGGGSSSGGVSFEVGVGLNLKNGVLSVDSASDFNGDNSRPAEAALVQTLVGNMEILLKTI